MQCKNGTAMVRKWSGIQETFPMPCSFSTLKVDVVGAHPEAISMGFLTPQEVQAQL